MPEIKTYTIAEPYLNLQCGLGEGPHWESSRNSLRFVDIVKKKLHVVNLVHGPSSHQQFDLDYSIACSADIDGDETRFVFGGNSGYGVFERETGEHRVVRGMWRDAERLEDGGGRAGVGRCKEERMRSNDGAVDARGRYFVGTMNDPALVGENFTDEGVLFRLDPDLSLHRVTEGVTIPNGTSWSADNKTMYFTDSPSGKIVAYPYDLETGEAMWDEGKTFFTCPYEGGVPDGHCQDEEGHFWVACFGTSKVVRVDPNGNVVAEVEVPTRCVTCPTLCGTELFITTAAELDPEKYPRSTKYQGSVFKVDVGVRGKPLNKFKMVGEV
ncbi:hypothetical protein M409DRAFT_60989 [Zasmidium cellare ATCC 36951]|uniref:SMP-30/Gluconolactonase/LRE-like region domain-containing protein n=1 Tax=Zasmidium cellare ATCC 36951 TaxID=1080233 RepID=A0A6A6C0F1_ZASCE|nr:uncharacterized protein M409DRAFT_60989 [Zasmidium cellare ATCC 36951]KAF2159292.1 hypothetical protein M409DRAFT_60989 [Zasmidium cellare ATCC 36951]